MAGFKAISIILSRARCARVSANFHSSTLVQKKRKTEEQSKGPREIVYPPKSKWKQGTVVDIWRNITVRELAKQLGRDVDHVFSVMEFIDNSAQYNCPTSVIDNMKVAEEVVKKSGFRFKMSSNPSEKKDENKPVDVTRRDKATYKDVRFRPPIVTVMGHVDHGKTTLLDTLRNTSVVEREFGGITQHIGAFTMLINDKDRVTFLDTPGHAAFCAMRNRGARCTDIVILVVAADDGVMEQTMESIKMAQDADVPIVVAINKIDKHGVDIESAKQALLQAGVQVEDAGGEVQVVPVSALKGTNINTLMEAVLVQAELLQLKTDYSGGVEAVVIESWSDPHRGKLCTLLIQCGTLKKGAVIVAGNAWGKVRAMFDDMGNTISEALPSFPVQTTGWRDLPSAGDVALEVESEKKAHQVIEWREARKMEQKQSEDMAHIQVKMEEHYKLYKEELDKKRKMGRVKIKPEGPRKKEIQDFDTGPRLNVIIKGDVDGSVEAILDVLETYNDPKCKLDVVHYGVGPVTLNDVTLAHTFSGTIYTFNTKVLKEAQTEAESKSVSLKSYNVIYKLVDRLKADMDSLLPLVDSQEVIGEANVQQEFLVTEGKSKVPVAGCRCVKGTLKKSAMFRLVRRGETLFDGTASSIRHLKDEVESIKKEQECGLRLDDPSIRLQAGDTIQCYIINKILQSVDWNPGF